MFIKNENFIFPADLVTLDMGENQNILVILGSSSLVIVIAFENGEIIILIDSGIYLQDHEEIDDYELVERQSNFFPFVYYAFDSRPFICFCMLVSLPMEMTQSSGPDHLVLAFLFQINLQIQIQEVPT